MGASADLQGFQPYSWLTAPKSDKKSKFEREAADAGAAMIAGVDEAGRGPLAGPIVAAAVVLGGRIKGVDDSKKLSEDEREALYDAITCRNHAFGVAIISPGEIDRMGIQSANYAAMAQALDALPVRPDFALIDGFNVPGCAVTHRRVIKGDALSWSIGAASIVAKVTRDRIMVALDAEYPDYGFAQHKGYGTAAHLDALQRLGPCRAHRRSFAPLAVTAETMMLLPERKVTV